MGARQDAEQVKAGFDSVIVAMGGLGTMKTLADRALRIPAPKGQPDRVDARADDYVRFGPAADAISVEIGQICANQVPEVWVGEASERANDTIRAAGLEIGRAVEVYVAAGRELDVLSAALRDGKAKFEQGVDAMYALRTELYAQDNAFDFGATEELKRKGQAAAGLMKDGWRIADDAGWTAASRFRDLASQARAAKLDSKHLTAADRLVMTQAAAPGGPDDLNAIMTTNDAERAGQRLDRLSEEERRRFDALLDGAKSPQERAYLMKALAAGHDMSAIEEFGRKIHPHGDDPAWLRDRLTPIVTPDDDTTPGSKDPVQSHGRDWSQGQRPTCVAYSTMAARAQADPLYALQLTTGGHPGDPAHDNPQAFADRARAESERIYEQGRDVGWHPFGQGDGMNTKQGLHVANEEISPATGGTYEHRDLDDAAERRSVLPEIEAAVDSGKPVPIQVRGDDAGHQMMIIGHDGDRLQIYNPWGNTVWVSKDDFINGHMQSATDERMPNAAGVHLPRN